MAGVVAAVDDLIFGARLQETARRLQVDLAFGRSPEDATALTKARRPTLVILDLQSEACHPLETIRRIKEDPDVRTAAAEAGCDELLPRSAFSARLAEILQRGAPATGEGCPPAATLGGTP